MRSGGEWFWHTLRKPVQFSVKKHAAPHRRTLLFRSLRKAGIRVHGAGCLRREGEKQ